MHTSFISHNSPVHPGLHTHFDKPFIVIMHFPYTPHFPLLIHGSLSSHNLPRNPGGHMHLNPPPIPDGVHIPAFLQGFGMHESQYSQFVPVNPG